MVWEHLDVNHAHAAYAILGIFAAVFMLVSLVVKEKAYIGEATVAAIVGLIVGPHALNWFSPTEWGNSDYITLEVSRIVLCLQIFAVAVELPKKYMLKHWLSVFMLLVPVMTAGWFIVAAFMYLLIPPLNFAESLVVSACITATDPVLAAAVVGKGKFAKRVPGHLRNLLSAESGCNDGMAFPFIYMGINLVIHEGNVGEIIKDWICVTVLYECILGCLIGVVIGYCGRHAIKWAEKMKLIDRESFLAFYIALAFSCAGVGSMLGVDDLLVSFAAGAAFSWDGWFAKKTEESHVSTVIDLLLNLAYFVYFGAIIPWEQFNSSALGISAWKMVILALVVIFLRRIPAVMALKPLIPDIKTWREALFCGHFGPIGVGAVFAAILARTELEGAANHEVSVPLAQSPSLDSKYGQLIAVIWPVVTFLVIASIIVHGSSVAVFTLGRHLNAMAISMSFTTTTGNEKSSSWMTRLPELRGNGRSFSLRRIDTQAPSLTSGGTLVNGELTQSATIETSGVKAKPAGGMARRSEKKKRRKHGKSRKNIVTDEDELQAQAERERKQREMEAQAASFAIGGNAAGKSEDFPEHNEEGYPRIGITPANTFNSPIVPFPTGSHSAHHEESDEEKEASSSTHSNDYERSRRPTNAYKEGNKLIVEDQHGEIIDAAELVQDASASLQLRKSRSNSSSIASVISPSRIGHISTDKRKFVAYKTGDQLIIENEDGEIVRRYRINQHAEHSQAGVPERSRSSTMLSEMTGKALSAVGLKRAPSSASASASSPTSSAPGSSRAHDKLSLHEPIRESEDEDEDEDDEFNSDEEEDDGSEEEETAVERQRRLAALGQIPGSSRDEDDEEVSPTKQVTSRSKMGTLMGGLMPMAIKEEKTQEQKSIAFQEPEKPTRR